MIQIYPLQEKVEIKLLFEKNSKEYNHNSCAMVAMEDRQQLGYCLFDLTENEIIIKALAPTNDLPLADGILRSALHMALVRGINSAKYSERAPVDVFRKLNFIENEDTKSLNIKNLLSACPGCDG